MKYVGAVLSTSCAIALVAALVPALSSGTGTGVASGATVTEDARKKPRPTKTPRPTKSPKPTPSAPVPVQARTIGEWVDRQWVLFSAERPRYSYHVEPVLEGSHWQEALVSGAQASFAIHAALGYPIKQDYRVYMGWDRQWLLDNLPPDTCSGGNWPTISQCWRSNVILANFAAWTRWQPDYTPASPPSPQDRLHIVGGLGHEVAHMVQQEISPRVEQRLWGNDSLWLIEGWAMLIDLMVAAEAYDLSYVEARDYKLNAMGWRCLLTDLKDLMDTKSPQECEYLRGLLAMEYLVWKTGDMGAGLTYVLQDASTPAEAFEQAFSLNLDDFMEEADIYADQEIRLYPLRKVIRST